jgi:hypothetical protein
MGDTEAKQRARDCYGQACSVLLDAIKSGKFPLYRPASTEPLDVDWSGSGWGPTSKPLSIEAADGSLHQSLRVRSADLLPLLKTNNLGDRGVSGPSGSSAAMKRWAEDWTAKEIASGRRPTVETFNNAAKGPFPNAKVRAMDRVRRPIWEAYNLRQGRPKTKTHQQ